jgi:indole-3-glycerol phosphate synthase / phosphoribosylanthranilate isomerase
MISKIDEILRVKRIDVAARKRARPHLDQIPARSSHLFRGALARAPKPVSTKQDPARFILEAKRVSPSEGTLRTELSARTVADAYGGVASAISVLTDGPFFGGSLEFLRELRALTETPLLCKDFVIDPYQVTEARSYGADAILLMLCVLNDDEVRACLAEVARLGMDALVEVHNADELARALALPAPIIGINNRSFHDLSVDLAVTERLAAQVGQDRTLISESGIYTHSDIQRLAPLVDGFLVGSSLMKQADLGRAARALVTGIVKICGLTHEDDVHAAARAGACMGGLIFAESARSVSNEKARMLASVSALPLVGVFRDAKLSEVAHVATDLKLAAVQLHGNETSAFVQSLRQTLPREIEIFSAVGVDLDGLGPVVADEPAATRLLFDSRAPSAPASGGAGVAFDWQRLAQHPRLQSAFIAGGISSENAMRARAAGSYGIDVGSGVESRPGRKSEAKLHALFDALRVPGRKRDS